ncbi:hypothetical protein F5Y00DRAFT_270122 [Daldinia vernicosa]|uniref:uncharacterized protein n=1 Tax=Daldinia vernicosa TaxID=114800 RepID=UPI002008BEA6|nr:uncharacterized protein F5Y00DRAFT_270122 [Daldinia vernicosa]KAI0848380.1 hypothetical protein F5Y00DRAFT_270122 [Daldinia vernicosa]
MGNPSAFKRHKSLSTGWKKAAKINCIILVCMSATLVGCSIATALQARSVQKILFFYGGDCDRGLVSKVNTAFHLLINVVSTLVVNVAHFKGSWLGIGVPSVRNVFHVSKFKTICWVILLASSIPIHVLFNSTILETDCRGTYFNLTIATEEFIHGATSYLPGASLLVDGVIFDPLNDGFEISREISSAARNSQGWERIENSECKQEYAGDSCVGLKRHGNLVLVTSQPGGWIRDVEMWHFNATQSRFWDKYVPSNQSNSLFYNAQCNMTAFLLDFHPGECRNSCIDSLRDDPFSYDLAEFALQGPIWHYYFNADLLSIINNTHREIWEYTSAVPLDAPELSIEYCLAERLDNNCQIGVSPALLMGVTICVVIKTCTAILATGVLINQKQTPLVTLGDAMASFIEKHDPTTAGFCSFGQDDARKTLEDKHVFISSGTRQWQTLNRRRAAAIPKPVWKASYLFLILTTLACASLFTYVYRYNEGMLGSFFEGDQNDLVGYGHRFAEAVMIANSPQLLLSLCYLIYNNLFTRLRMAREWSLFSQGYQPLRVTDPQGEQYATYRLQLPYKYSIPLIFVSISLHWLLSNTIYIFVSTGFESDPNLPPETTVAVGYSIYAFMTILIVTCVLITIPPILSVKRLPSDMLNIGSNSFSLSAACHVSRLSHAVTAQMNSISPDLADLEFEQTASEAGPDSIEMQQLVMTHHPPTWEYIAPERLLIGFENQGDGDRNDERSGFRNLARSRIRWGVVQMPPEWYAEYEHEGAVEHLSFGVEEDDVQPPVAGHLYA